MLHFGYSAVTDHHIYPSDLRECCAEMVAGTEHLRRSGAICLRWFVPSSRTRSASRFVIYATYFSALIGSRTTVQIKCLVVLKSKIFPLNAESTRLCGFHRSAAKIGSE
ncbi:hypothetical protein TSMEX_001342 [Taenia solium]|eukprot:TsM_000630200 transcript=TsM_000630200 gene=TsM_000630200